MFCEENAIENVDCKMSTILFRPQYAMKSHNLLAVL